MTHQCSTVPIGDLCQVIGGGTPSRKNEVFYQGDIPWVTVKDFDGLFLEDAQEHITQEAVRSSATNIIPVDSVLVVTRVGLGKVALVRRPLAINQDVKALIPDARVEPEYLLWFMNSCAPEIQRMGVGATVKGITLKDLKEIQVPLPARTEQRRIVDILKRADGIRRLRKQAIQTARELIPALFVDIFGDPATNPKRWPEYALGNLCDLVRGSSPRPQGDRRYFGGPVPRLMIADITRDGILVTPRIDSLTLEGAKKSRSMKAGDVVMAVSGAVGLPAILAVDACIHDGFVGFRELRTDLIAARYLCSYLQSLRHRATHEAVGAIFQNLTTDQIRRWTVPVPPHQLQDEFVSQTEQIRAIEWQQEEATRKVESTFSALLHRAFRGEL